MTDGGKGFYDLINWEEKPKTKLGLILTYDDRDTLFALSQELDAAAKLTNTYFFTCQKIEHQTTNPWCVGGAWRHFLTANPLQTQLGPSMRDIYFGSRAIAKIPDHIAGSDIRAAAKYLQALGHIDKYVWTKSFDDIRYWIQARCAMVVTGTEWWSDMSTPDRNGFIHPTGEFQDYHAYCLAGWSHYRQAFRILNSWGPEYGENGRAWLHVRDFMTLLERGGVYVTATEKAIGLKARERSRQIIAQKPHLAVVGGTVRPQGKVHVR